MNKVILIGRLARDPEMRTTSSGVSVTRFTVAVTRQFTGQGTQPQTDFISCIAWRRQAENIAKYCTKGSQVAVDGRIQTGSYDGKDGNKRWVTEVIADRFELIESRKDFAGAQHNNAGANQSYAPAAPRPQQPGAPAGNMESFGNAVPFDEEIPF